MKKIPFLLFATLFCLTVNNLTITQNKDQLSVPIFQVRHLNANAASTLQVRGKQDYLQQLSKAGFICFRYDEERKSGTMLI